MHSGSISEPAESSALPIRARAAVPASVYSVDQLWLNGVSDVGRTNGTAPDGSIVGFHGNGPAPRSLADYYFDSEPDFSNG